VRHVPAGARCPPPASREYNLVQPGRSVVLPTGTRLGRYELLPALGEGGMGEVYRAKDERLGREVAVKILPPSFSADPDRLRRFEQEARATGALNHPNVIVVHDRGQHDGAPYVVYELLERDDPSRAAHRRAALGVPHDPAGNRDCHRPGRRTIAGSSTAISNRRNCLSRAKDT
jgi:hypothetical protein